MTTYAVLDVGGTSIKVGAVNGTDVLIGPTVAAHSRADADRVLGQLRIKKLARRLPLADHQIGLRQLPGRELEALRLREVTVDPPVRGLTVQLGDDPAVEAHLHHPIHVPRAGAERQAIEQMSRRLALRPPRVAPGHVEPRTFLVRRRRRGWGPRSWVSASTPCSRSSIFRTFSDGVFGSASTNRR